jgi:hypothetical protein
MMHKILKDFSFIHQWCGFWATITIFVVRTVISAIAVHCIAIYLQYIMLSLSISLSEQFF